MDPRKKILAVNFHASYQMEKNFADMKMMIRRAGREHVDLVVFPESALQGYMPSAEESSARFFDQHAIELHENNPFLAEFISLAKEHKLSLVFGCIERDVDRAYVLYNTAVLINPDGTFFRYRKVHLATNESLFFHPGEKLEVFDSNIGKIGMLICYDICFPEAARSLALAGAETIILISAWGFSTPKADPKDSSLAVFDLYAQCRAVENQALVIVANQSGLTEDNNIHFLGSSKIVKPNGEIFAHAQHEPAALTASIPIQDWIKEERLHNLNAMNLLRNRRPHIYRN